MSVQVPLLEQTTAKPPKVAARVEEIVGEGFNVKNLIANFEVLAEAAGGVLRLRQLVAGLGLKGGLSGRSQVAFIAKAISVPGDWRRVKMGEVAGCVLGKMLDQAKHTKGARLPYLRNINVRWGAVDLSDLREMYFQDHELERYGVRLGDVLICEGGEPGRAACWTDTRPMLIQKAIHRVRPTQHVLPAWIVLNLRHDTWSGRLDEFFTGATIKHFTGKALESYSIWLPPLAEQKRIVAKVDQLMALCDELEARQTKKRETGTRLTKSALEALTSAEGPEEFDAACKRVVDNFDVLIDRVEKLVDLRLSILELAVRGLLSRRQSQDEPVENLLVKIVAERTAARARGARVPHVEPIGQTEGPYLIPNTWRWLRWGDLTVGSDSGWSPQCETRPRNDDEWGVVKVSAVSWGVFMPHENKALPKGSTPREDCAIQKGDFLMSRANTAELVGRSVVVADDPGKLMMSDKIVRCTFAAPVNKDYVNLFNKTVSARAHYVAKASGTSDSMKNISRDVIFSMPVPLPSQNEQTRIVAKVNQLMKFCDAVEARFHQAEDRATKLVDAMVQEFVG